MTSQAPHFTSAPGALRTSYTAHPSNSNMAGTAGRQMTQQNLTRSPPSMDQPDGGDPSKRRRVDNDEQQDSNLSDGSPPEMQPGKVDGSSSSTSKQGSGDDSAINGGVGGASKGDAPKRIKTARACDSCRRKKIRCDVIDDGSPPPGDPNNGNGGLTCAHCRQYGFSCTFFLPITETRFKKKREREAEEAAARNAAGGSFTPLGGPGLGGGILSPFGHPGPMPAASISAAQEWPAAAPKGLVDRFHHKWGSGSSEMGGGPGLSPKSHSPIPPLNSVGSGEAGQDKAGDDIDPGPPPDMRVMGPTSLAYIVHSTAFVPGSAIEAHDLKHSQTFEVGASGDGIIKLNRPRNRKSSVSSSGDDEDATIHIPDAIRGRLAGDVAEKLINSYFEKIGYLFPVVTKSEFLHLTTPPAILFYAICGVAALDRNVPREVLSAVRIGLNAIFRDSDILSNSSAVTVRALLILSLHGDVHGSTNVQSGSRMWNRLGVALRMAQDLGLHRDASGRDDIDSFAHYLEQKRRIWGACVTADRLVSIALGHPLAIDLTDCDVRLPSPHEVTRFPTDLPSLPGEDRPFGFNTEMLKLAILFGRVQKTIYSPTGLMKATDEEITGLLSDIDQWRENLPDNLRYAGPNSSPSVGILQLAFSCIQMLFFRVFMRISYSCPQHLKFSLTIERMTSLIRWSRESIDWVDQSGDLYLDTMQFVSYALVFCATVQYHSWVRRGDEEGLKSLLKLKETVSRGKNADSSKPDLSLRGKTAEIIGLLHEAASGQWANTPSTGNLNPTAGVVNRRTADSVKGIIWRNAPGRPGGGAYEASEPHLLLSDLPPGTIIMGSNRTPALVRSANGWQQVPGVLNDQPSATPVGGVEGNSGDSNLPDLSSFTHLGGNVWQDESGWPVDQRGSGLTVVLPQNGGAMHQHQYQNLRQQHQQQHQQQQHSQQQSLYGLGPQNPLGMGGMNVNPHLNGVSMGDPDGMVSSLDGTHNGQNSGLAATAAGAGGGLPPAAGSIPTAAMGGNNTGVGPSISAGGGGGDGSEAFFTAGNDPLMLNDPLMGMLDWQAWQSYLAPFSNNTQASGNGGNAELSGSGTPNNGQMQQQGSRSAHGGQMPGPLSNFV